jgi:hypothetical protein
VYIVPAFGRLRQEDCELEVSLGYIARSCHKRKKAGREEGKRRGRERLRWKETEGKGERKRGRKGKRRGRERKGKNPKQSKC